MFEGEMKVLLENYINRKTELKELQMNKRFGINVTKEIAKTEKEIKNFLSLCHIEQLRNLILMDLDINIIDEDIANNLIPVKNIEDRIKKFWIGLPVEIIVEEVKNRSQIPNCRYYDKDKLYIGIRRHYKGDTLIVVRRGSETGTFIDGYVDKLSDEDLISYRLAPNNKTMICKKCGQVTKILMLMNFQLILLQFPQQYNLYIIHLHLVL